MQRLQIPAILSAEPHSKGSRTPSEGEYKQEEKGEECTIGLNMVKHHTNRLHSRYHLMTGHKL